MAFILKTWNDLYTLVATGVSYLSDDELRAVYNRIASPMLASPMDKATYGEYLPRQNEAVKSLYWAVVNEQDVRYRNAHEGECREMFRKYFEGKTWEQIKSNEELYELWGSYSDFHKDVYGYRPHGIVCGVYINPHA